MFKLNRLITSKLANNINKLSLFNLRNFSFSQSMNINHSLQNSFININTCLPNFPQTIQNIDDIQNIKNLPDEEIMEFKNKTNNLAARKRKKRKTGKKISLRWR